MTRRVLVLLTIVSVLVLASGCLGRHSPSGFRLPPGSVEAGQAAFVDLKCHTCHRVGGADLPGPTATTVVSLGGRTALPPTDGDLVTDIIIPSSHFAAGYAAERIQSGGSSRMPDYNATMTVRQLADLVAFLQAHHQVVVSPGPKS